MGYVEILIGRLDDDVEEEVLAAGGDRDGSWRRAGPDIASINILNIASVGAFLSHVAGLAGVKAELEIVRELSPLRLRTEPEGYDVMHADPLAFARRESVPGVRGRAVGMARASRCRHPGAGARRADAMLVAPQAFGRSGNGRHRARRYRGARGV